MSENSIHWWEHKHYPALCECQDFCHWVVSFHLWTDQNSAKDLRGFSLQLLSLSSSLSLTELLLQCFTLQILYMPTLQSVWDLSVLHLGEMTRPCLSSPSLLCKLESASRKKARTTERLIFFVYPFSEITALNCLLFNTWKTTVSLFYLVF